MKRIIFYIFLSVFCILPIFSQEKLDATDLNSESESEFSISVLDERFLINVPEIFSDASYQNPAGQKFKHKEVTQMLLTVPENEKIIGQYRGWSAMTFALLGVFCAGIATHAVYTINDDLPNADMVKEIAVYTSAVSLPFAFFTSSIAGQKYKVAVDNYNLDVIRQK